MSEPPQITVEDDAPPIVRVFANRLKHSATRPAGEHLINAMQGTFALESTTDPQAVTIKISGGCVELSGGVSRTSNVVLHVDFNKLGEVGYKPKIDGFLTHPHLTYQIGRLLSLPPPNWADSAKRFWSLVFELPDMPRTLKITCTNESRSLSFGETTDAQAEPDTEIIADSSTLAEIFTGNAVLLNEVVGGKAWVRTSLQHMAGLSQAGIRMLMGEISG
jgi:hypothetical protein